MTNTPRIPGLVASIRPPFHADGSHILAIFEKRQHNLDTDPAR